MKIIGIDPGTTRVGYCVLLVEKKKVSLVTYGCFLFDDKLPDERPAAAARAVRDLMAKERPAAVSLERVFFSKNKKTAIAVSESRGAILAAVAEFGVDVYSFTPPQVKQAVGTTAAAGKKGVQKMVQLILKLPSPPRPDDAADAIAIALCCANTFGDPRLP